MLVDSAPLSFVNLAAPYSLDSRNWNASVQEFSKGPNLRIIVQVFVDISLGCLKLKMVYNFNKINLMNKASRSPTLREYIQSYQDLKRSKSNNNLLSLEKINVYFKPTHEFEHQINQKFLSLKKILTNNSKPNPDISALQCLHELTKIITQVLQKLKHLQGIDGNLKPSAQLSTSPHINQKKISLHEKKLNSRRKAHKQQPQPLPSASPSLSNINLNTDLISPQQLSKQIKFSNDLSNPCLQTSQTTQDLSPRLPKRNKISIAEDYFQKQINGINSVGPERESSSRCSFASVDEYRIKVSHCQSRGVSEREHD